MYKPILPPQPQFAKSLNLGLSPCFFYGVLRFVGPLSKFLKPYARRRISFIFANCALANRLYSFFIILDAAFAPYFDVEPDIFGIYLIKKPPDVLSGGFSYTG